MRHTLFIQKPYSTDVFSGKKRFEFRKNDRDFHLDDLITLVEIEPVDNPSKHAASMRETGLRRVYRVDYILYGGVFGLPEGYCIMSIIPY